MTDFGKKISLIIPTLNAGPYIGSLLDKISEQTIPVDEIIVIDSSSDDETVKVALRYKNVKILEIERKNFNHGGTRDFALQQTAGDIVCFITQDAIPCNENYIENLIKPFAKDSAIAMVSGRQVAKVDATNIEKLTRAFNYPEFSFVRSKQDIERLGVKAFFASDCCSAYRRAAYLAVGGFDKNILINEDMKIAAVFLYASYKIAYAGNAAVYHSHNYTLKQQFVRNFDVGAFIAMHPQFFSNCKVKSEGVKMVKYVFVEILKRRHFFYIPYYIVECTTKLLANKMGNRYQKLSKSMIMRMTMHKSYWENKGNYINK